MGANDQVTTERGRISVRAATEITACGCPRWFPTITRSAPSFSNAAGVEPGTGSIIGPDGCRSHVARIAILMHRLARAHLATINSCALSKWRDVGRHPYENAECFGDDRPVKE
jgi:hypothetical protein